MTTHTFKDGTIYADKSFQVGRCIKCNLSAWYNVNQFDEIKNKFYYNGKVDIPFVSLGIIIKLNEYEEIIEKIACKYTDEEWMTKEIIE